MTSDAKESDKVKDAAIPIIGGMFGKSTAKANGSITPPDFLGKPYTGFVNARSALYAALAETKPTRVWVPSFLCGSLLHAIAKLRIDFRFYSIDQALNPVPEELQNIRRGEVFLFINYFGFLFNPELLQEVRSRGAVIIEDASHSLFSLRLGSQADYTLLSPRKFLGVPDGGLLIRRNSSECKSFALRNPPSKWKKLAFDAFSKRTRFDYSPVSENDWFELFRQAEACQPCGYYEISELTLSLLQEAFDYDEIVRIRRSNFEYLLGQLPEIALFMELPGDVVPIGFPVVSKRRNSIRSRLIEQKIYPAIHWNIADFVPLEFSDSHELTADILTIPCDQRIGPEGLERIVHFVKKELT